ncbi:dienelactone hydrolase family protein [bacterium]|nr:dienelactone hydrolase family protein [bacterium]MBU1636617.1 dienelactone hydrolase family protein [bacterium]
MFRRLSFLLVSLLLISAVRAEPIELTISVSASPLQAWRAMCVDWQIRQWTDAESAYFELRSGGPWRITHPDQSLEEGIIETAQPAERLVYSYLIDDTETRVSIGFSKSETGCDISITHDEFGKGRSGEKLRSELLENWELKLPSLSAYLDRIPGSYLALPYGEATNPAVLLLHDRFGLNRALRDLADSLAQMGYVALAIDMFKGDVTSDMTQAARFLELVNNEESIQTARDGFLFLRDNKQVNRKRIAVWGIGYGGSMAVHLSAQVPEFKYCVNWYGTELPGATQLPRIACPVFAVFANPATNISTPQAENFNQSLTQAGVIVETILVQGYDGFADRAYGTTYSPSAIADALRLTLMRLDRVLKL